MNETTVRRIVSETVQAAAAQIAAAAQAQTLNTLITLATLAPLLHLTQQPVSGVLSLALATLDILIQLLDRQLK